MTLVTRRDFVGRTGLGLLTFCVGGCDVELTPREARTRGAELRVLSAKEVACLEALGEALLPGSRDAGVASYVDHQLAEPAQSQLLMIRYLNVPAPFAPFYTGGLAALDRAAQVAETADFDALDAPAQKRLVAQMASENPPGWNDGPPAAFFFFVVRSDALDVSYGTMEGFASLGIPYMAHIVPPTKWGQ